MDIKGLVEILREAAAIIRAIPCGGEPDNMRYPISDELEGFALAVESGDLFKKQYVSLARYDELADLVDSIGAGGIKGQLMPGAQPAASAEPSDTNILAEWAFIPNSGDMRVDLVAFARALLSRYGRPAGDVQPAASAEPLPDALADALSNLEHDNYERSYSGSKNRESDAALIRTALAQQDAAKADVDPLQGAAEWLLKAVHDCEARDLQHRLLIGHNRATRLIEAARKGVEA